MTAQHLNQTAIRSLIEAVTADTRGHASAQDTELPQSINDAIGNPCFLVDPRRINMPVTEILEPSDCIIRGL